MDITISVRDILILLVFGTYIFLMDNLPMDIVNQISALLNPSNSDGSDTLGRGGTNTHQFTVQSAYNL